MTLPSNNYNKKEYTRLGKPKRSESPLILIIIFGFIVIAGATNYHRGLGFIAAIVFSLIFIGLASYGNNRKLGIILIVAMFIGILIPMGALWSDHVTSMQAIHSHIYK